MNNKYIRYTKPKNTQNGGNIGDIVNVLSNWNAQKVATRAEIEAYKTMLNGNNTLPSDVKQELHNMLNLLTKTNDSIKISDMIPATADMIPEFARLSAIH